MSQTAPMLADDRLDNYGRQNGTDRLTPAQQRRVTHKEHRGVALAHPDRTHWLALYTGKRAAIREQRKAARRAGNTPVGRGQLARVVGSAFWTRRRTA